jgi:hypothetical protein
VNLLHEGTFTTSSSACPTGTAEDVSIDEATLTAVRQFTCDAGGWLHGEGGAPPRRARRQAARGRSLPGSGALADLRGKGTFTSVRLTGDPNNPETITFRSTWTGVAALDATPPTTGVKHWRAKKLERPKGAYKVTLGLSLTDNGGGPVSYQLELVNPKRPSHSYAFKLGKTATGSVTRSFRIRVGKRTRRVRLKIEATDAVGNESAFAKTLRLR